MMKMQALVAAPLTATMMLAFCSVAVADTVKHMTTRCTNGKFFSVGFDDSGGVTSVKSNFGGVYTFDGTPCRDLPEVKCSIYGVKDGIVTIKRGFTDDEGVDQATVLGINFDENDEDYGGVAGFTQGRKYLTTKIKLDCKAD